MSMFEIHFILFSWLSSIQVMYLMTAMQKSSQEEDVSGLDSVFGCHEEHDALIHSFTLQLIV